MDLSKPILLVVKKSFYEIYGLDKKDSRFLALLEADSTISSDLMSAHEENIRAVAGVEEHLNHHGVAYVKSSGNWGKVDGRFSLVVAVGGDGTLLAASHTVIETAVVAINSRPGRSIGYFCAADKSNFKRVLDAILGDRLQPRELMRMDVYINGFKKSPPVLNDVLYAGHSPATTMRYLIEMDGISELHRSSGVWVSTPAGSTGGIRAGGGRKMSLSEQRMQFLVREPYTPKGIRNELERGIFEDGLAITNLTPEAMVYFDGTRIAYPLDYGDVIETRVSNFPLRIYL